MKPEAIVQKVVVFFPIEFTYIIYVNTWLNNFFFKLANFIFQHGILATNGHAFTNFMPVCYFEN